MYDILQTEEDARLTKLLLTPRAVVSFRRTMDAMEEAERPAIRG